VKHGWIQHAGPYRIEHIPCPHPGLVDETAPPKGCLHTTEGSFSSALNTFKGVNAPTFLVGERRIAQLIPLGYMAACLRHTSDPPTNGICRVQIEIAGFAKKVTWLPFTATLDPLAALMATLVDVAQIPLVHPEGIARDGLRWVRARGWVGHFDAPENDHWDPGVLDWNGLFARAERFLDHPKPAVKPRPQRRFHVVWRHGIPYIER
jgi:hypothetical protein